MSNLLFCRDPRQERGFEQARNRFYDMLQELTLYQQYELGDWNTNLMNHHFTKSWCVLPDEVDAEHLTDFIDGNEPMIENLLSQLTGTCTNALITLRNGHLEMSNQAE